MSKLTKVPIGCGLNEGIGRSAFPRFFDFHLHCSHGRSGRPGADLRALIKWAAVWRFRFDLEGKPVGINQHIGRRPVASFGNSDGDLQMLQWTTAGQGPQFALYVHHTDGVREWSYDRESSIGRLDIWSDQGNICPTVDPHLF